VEKVVKSAASANVPIRIGVNSGSIEKAFKKTIKGDDKHLTETAAQAMAQSALKHIRILEKLKFRNIKVSLKATAFRQPCARELLRANAIIHSYRNH
jgi:(E)-4-hydroxy-3-methylbut-2-enyl-diphosphate synthase